MSNLARITLPTPTTLAEYHAALKEALQATFGDALTLDPDVPTEPDLSGLYARVDGRHLCQWFYESPTEWSVDHRQGNVGFWVADRVFYALATKLGDTGPKSTNKIAALIMDQLNLRFGVKAVYSHESLFRGNGLVMEFEPNIPEACWNEYKTFLGQ
jgi:hypothetical protein